MKKLPRILLILTVIAGELWCLREPIIDLLPIDQSGWKEREGSRYYVNEKGDPLTGWQKLEDSTFYFSESGVMHTGWLEEGEDRFCFDQSGAMLRGWQTLQGKTHRFDQNGRLMHGFLEEAGKRFYLDENGCPDIGFFPDGENTYFVVENGEIQTGWLNYEEKIYYLDENGTIRTGWMEEAGKRYHFGEADGAMSTGLTEINGITYGFDETGVCLNGWVERNGQRYYFNQDGAMYTGWLEENGKKYYLKEDGTAAVGKLMIDGEACFFSSSGVNFIMVNPWHFLPEGFEPELVAACGTWLDPQCREALEKMFADCRAAGFSPRMISGYRSIADQRVNLQNKVIALGGDYAAATKIIAVPGTSEHHLGLAFDIVDSAYPELNHWQAQMPTQKWLMEHCWEYGFILRYPDNSTEITGIIWEPWHYRYVGVEMALEIRDMGCITLEEYIDILTNDGTTCGGKQTNE